MAAQVLIVVSLLVVEWVVGQSIPLQTTPWQSRKLDPSTCPPTYEDHPLILISVDGFRAEYLTRKLTPTIDSLGNLGVRAPYMKPSFPTITFPNHYTLATGLYPPAHGIVANKFYDPVFDAEFRVGREESFKKRWWGGEPIWKTVKRQGKKSATFFWPGSETTGNTADYWSYYNESIPFSNRIDQALEWLDLPPSERPSLITLYMHEPDSTGHDFGPYSPQIEEALRLVDTNIKRLLNGLTSRNLLSCVNLLVVADHGMAEAGDDKTIILDQFIPDIKTTSSRFWKGAFVRIQPTHNTPQEKRRMMKALSCKKPVMRVYEKTTLPIRWHMGAQRRVEDIVVDVDAGYSVGIDSSFVADKGEHGYDNIFPVMNALFVAYGPDLKNGVEVEAFQNIELYNLMCHLVKVTPAPNNGTWGALNHMLKRPPPVPIQPRFEAPPPLANLPSCEDIEEHLKEGRCEGDSADDDVDDWLNILADSQKHVQPIVDYHLPWGRPSNGQFKDHVVLLPHQDTVTAFSPLLNMPLWTSFTTTGYHKGSRPKHWRSDVRLELPEISSCLHYHALNIYNITRQPLFPAEFSRDESYAQIPYLMSNAVPVTKQLNFRWKQLKKYVKLWTRMYGPLNVITGPVFDYDSDTFVDSLDFLSTHRGLKVPTHLFMVVTRCLDRRYSSFSECPHAYLDTVAFVYPQSLAVQNCLNAAKFAQEFMAKVQDVEKITGLQFFQEMRFEDRVRLQIRIHSNIWSRESWGNRLLTNFFDIGK